MSEAVLKYIKTLKRPFILKTVYDNFQKMKKSTLKDILQGFVVDGVLMEKRDKKQKIYFLPNRDIEEEIIKINKEIEELSKENENIEKNLSKILSDSEELEELNELIKQISVLTDEIKSFEEQLKYCENTDLSDNAEEIVRKHEFYLKEYRKRKRICTNAIDTIYENYPKGKKLLLEELQIETDEDVGFSLK